MSVMKLELLDVKLTYLEVNVCLFQFATVSCQVLPCFAIGIWWLQAVVFAEQLLAERSLKC